MDKRVYLLTIVSFVVGMVELIIGGILDIVADDLKISLGQAGQLITVFSLVFAIAAPVLMTMTAKMERKKLTLLSLVVFFLGNLAAVFGSSFSTLMIARIVSAASGSLLVVLCVTLAAGIVDKQYRARAIGIVFMGVSGSLVLGVPAGLMLGNAFGWRAPFMLIAGLTILSFIGVYFFMGEIAPKSSVSIKEQLAALKNKSILFAQLTTFLFLAGHLTLYGYLTPFLKTSLGLDGAWISIVYLVFGIAAVSGGGIGGALADKLGAKTMIVSVTIVFAAAIFAIPHTTFSFPLFLMVMVVWSAMSWAITPAIQSYLIETAPETSEIQQSLNNSALHFGIAFGSFIGGLVIERSTVGNNPVVGGIIVILALGAAVISMGKNKEEALELNRKSSL
ncbi:MFS transporter [Sediminibacillus massiliensis]|uniref:MFS transporter n=1 Tax=Sediminibacillus massiliensis TaxID=1926277 RepID=UPI0009883664|nr:MFS transporter [Sediminibacillus massiliensis]